MSNLRKNLQKMAEDNYNEEDGYIIAKHMKENLDKISQALVQMEENDDIDRFLNDKSIDAKQMFEDLDNMYEKTDEILRNITAAINKSNY